MSFFNFRIISDLPIPIGEDGPIVLLMRSTHNDKDRFKFTDCLKLMHTMHDILSVDNDNVVIAGFIGVMDLKKNHKNINFEFEDFSKFSKILSKFAHIRPTQLKSWHYINVPDSIRLQLQQMLKVLEDEIGDIVSMQINNVLSIFNAFFTF